MAIEKTLLLKALAGVAAVGSVGGVGGVVIKNKLDERAAEEKKKNAKREEVNGKLKTLGIVGCDLEDKDVTSPTVFSKNCELDQTKFKNINFSNKPTTGNVTVEGWDNQNGKINLKIENKEGEENGIKFTFSGAPSDLIVKGGDSQDNKFSIKANKETEFEEKPDGKLKKKFDDTISQKLKTYNTKLESLSLPASCRFDDTEDEKRLECEIKGSELKNIKFSSKEDNNPLTLNGLTDTDKIKLIIERDTASQTETLKYKLKNDKSSSITIMGKVGEQKKIVLKSGVETEFENKNDGKLSKIISNQATSTKLKGYNTNLEKLSLPNGCIFDVADTDTSLECSIDKDQIKTIKFSNKGTNDLTISEGSDFTGLKLNISESGSNLKFNFKGGNKKIKLTNDKKHVFIKQGEENEFEFKGEALRKVLSKEVNKLTKKVGLICEYGDSGDGGECKLSDDVNLLKMSQGDSTGALGISIDNDKRNKVKFTFSEDQSNYEGGVKFTFTGEEIGYGGATLEKGKGYEVKTFDRTYYLSKKTR